MPLENKHIMKPWERTLAKAYDENGCRTKMDFARLIEAKQQDWKFGGGHVSPEDKPFKEAVDTARQFLRQNGLQDSSINLGSLARQESNILNGRKGLEEFNLAAPQTQAIQRTPEPNRPTVPTGRPLIGMEP